MKNPPVLMIPGNHEYVFKLIAHLTAIHIPVALLKPFHYSTPANLVKILWCRARGSRLIHVHWLYIFPCGWVMKLLYYFFRSLGIKILWEMHNIIPHQGRESDRKNSRWFFEKVDAVIFHSPADIPRAREILKTPKRKNHIVIPHGNFNGSYPNRIGREEAKRILGVEAYRKVILCFGFIRRNRGYEILMRATEQMTQTAVVIAGKIEERDVYGKIMEYGRTRPDLRIFGKWIPDEEVQVYFNACDVVVLPYTAITTSGVIPLAYAFSKPVITTDVGGLGDVVNESTGVLIPPNDAGELRRALERIFEKDVEAMGKRAYEYAREELNWDVNVRKISELYSRMLVQEKPCRGEKAAKFEGGL